LRPSLPITTTVSQRTLTVQAVIHLENEGTAASTLTCWASLSNQPIQFVGVIAAGGPPAPNHAWFGQITLLGRWGVSAGTHTVTVFCHPSEPLAGTGTVLISGNADILLTAAP
jgi:hypothetical protein